MMEDPKYMLEIAIPENKVGLGEYYSLFRFLFISYILINFYKSHW